MNIFAKKPVLALLFALLAFSIYSYALKSPFYFDDYYSITENESVAIREISFDALKKAATSGVSGFRPLPQISFAINYFLSAGDPVSYHVVNLLLHTINALLVYMTILALFGAGTRDNESNRTLRASALFTALIWLAAPINSHAVISIVQRMALMMTMFFLGSCLMYIRGRKSGHPLYFIFSLILYTLAILSKQNAVVLPIVILTYELVIIRKGDIKSITKTGRGIFAVLIIVLLITLAAFGNSILSALTLGYKLRDFSMLERLLTQPRVIIFYLSLLILPIPGRFCITHIIEKSTSLTSPLTTLFSIIAIVIMLAVAIVRMKRSPYLSFTILWFFITISVESSILPLEMAFEHRMYLPGIFLIGAAVDHIVSRYMERSPKAVTAALLAVVILFGTATTMRSMVWANGMTLWSDVVEKYPNNARANYNLGKAYIRNAKFKEAEPHIIRAIENWDDTHIFDFLYMAYNHLGAAQLKMNKLADAKVNLRKSIDINPDYAPPYSNIGYAYLIEGDYKEALKIFEKSVDIDPSYASSYVNIGTAYYAMDDPDSAFRYFNKALNLDPQRVSAYRGLGLIYQDRGDIAKAITYFEKAVYFDPNDQQTRKNIERLKREQAAGK